VVFEAKLVILAILLLGQDKFLANLDSFPLIKCGMETCLSQKSGKNVMAF